MPVVSPLARPRGAPARRVAAGDQRDRRPLGRLRAARGAPVRGDRGAGGPDGLAAGAARSPPRCGPRCTARAASSPRRGHSSLARRPASPSSGATTAPRRSSRSSPTSRSRTSSPTGPDVGERMEAFATRREPGPWAGQLWAAIGATAFARAGLDDARAGAAGDDHAGARRLQPVGGGAARGGRVRRRGHLGPARARARAAAARARRARSSPRARGTSTWPTRSSRSPACSRCSGASSQEAFARARAMLRGARPARARRDRRPRRRPRAPPRRSAGAEPLLAAAAERFETLGMTAWRERPARGRATACPTRSRRARPRCCGSSPPGGRTRRSPPSSSSACTRSSATWPTRTARSRSATGADATAYVLRSRL